MSHRLYEPPMIAWGRTGARVQLALSSTRGSLGSRRWSVRMTHGPEQYDLPLGFSTPAGLDPMLQTRTAVLCCAGRLLAELGAIPTDTAGLPIGDPHPHSPQHHQHHQHSDAHDPHDAGGPLLLIPTPTPPTVKVETRVRSFPLLGAR